MSKAAELANLIGNINAGGGGVNRNFIINGAMNVAQRATSATGIGTAAAYNTVDRWRFADANNPTGRFTQTQSTDAPEGFSFSHKFEVTTNDAGVDDDEMQFTHQFIEAQNLQRLDYGTSNARTITLSFYVKSSVASTMGVRFAHEDSGGSYGASYTINSVDTWERKSITVPGNTATAINNDNGKGMSIRFGLSVGADNKGTNSTAWGNGNIFGTHTNTFVGTSGATWQVTGVQLEIGQNATEFEHEPFDVTREKCYRYCQRHPSEDPTSGSGYSVIADGHNDTTTNFLASIDHHSPMRSDTSISSSGNLRVHIKGDFQVVTNISIDDNTSNRDRTTCNVTVSSGLTAGEGAYLEQNNDSDAHVIIDAEL